MKKKLKFLGNARDDTGIISPDPLPQPPPSDDSSDYSEVKSRYPFSFWKFNLIAEAVLVISMFAGITPPYICIICTLLLALFYYLVHLIVECTEAIVNHLKDGR